MNGLSLVDWVLIVVLAAATLGGLLNGFFRSLFGAGGLIAGLVLAAWNYRRAAHLIPGIHDEKVLDIVAFVLIALIVMVLAHVVGSLLGKIMEKIGLGCLDRLGGAVVGFVEGVLLVTLVIWVTVAFLPDTAWLTASRVPRYFFGVCHLSTHVSPNDLSERVRIGLRELEEKTPEWMHQNQKVK